MPYCYVCKEHKRTLSFVKDDPVLSCGHVKKLPSTDDAMTMALEATEKRIQKHINEGKTRAEACRLAAQESINECKKSREKDGL